MATATFVPNGVGDYTNIAKEEPADAIHWTLVDDPPASPDDLSTYVYSTDAAQVKDAYDLVDHTTESGTINSVKVYFRTISEGNFVQPFLRLGTDETAGTEITATASWVTYSEILARPGGGDWSWTDIDNLQVVIGLRKFDTAFCTQIYIEVDYTPVAVGRSYGYIIG